MSAVRDQIRCIRSEDKCWLIFFVLCSSWYSAEVTTKRNMAVLQVSCASISAIDSRVASEHRANPNLRHRWYSERVDCVDDSISRRMESEMFEIESISSINYSNPWQCVRDPSRTGWSVPTPVLGLSPSTSTTSHEIPWRFLKRRNVRIFKVPIESDSVLTRLLK